MRETESVSERQRVKRQSVRETEPESQRAREPEPESNIVRE